MRFKQRPFLMQRLKKLHILGILPRSMLYPDLSLHLCVDHAGLDRHADEVWFLDGEFQG